MDLAIKEKSLSLATLCFLMRRLSGGQVLLARKPRHQGQGEVKIGAGFRNGYGGGPKGKEVLEVTASRETGEESGGVEVPLATMERIAIVDFHTTKSDGTTFTCRVHSFISYDWRGEPRPTAEMEDPRWFDISRLPFEQMMPADRFWLPQALRDKNVYAEAWYGPRQQSLLRPVEITRVSDWRSVPTG